MYLKRIELHGFKTFAGRTTIELRPGITAIVGPNGSGKSNIADAVRWALGETNLRQVRCRTSDELIFAGSTRRASLGMAEISLIFANEGGWLALPFSEVRVTRRAYRSGENEYMLNGSRVRLREIVDLLAGASIHAGGHVVVGQGLVDAVLALRPEERRLLVENLAGLKQYYLRRDDAEGRLTGTEDNLVHVDALVAELAPQVENLAAQADALRRYRACEDELRTLQRRTFGVQAARIMARTTAGTARAAETGDAVRAARAEVARLQSEGDALDARLATARAALADLRERLSRQTALHAAARRDRDVAAAQLAAAETTGRTSQEELEILTRRVAEARAEHAGTEAVLDTIRGAVGVAEAARTKRREALCALTEARGAALAAHRAAETAAQAAAARVSRLVESMAATSAALEGRTAEVRRSEVAAAEATKAFAEAETAHRRAMEEATSSDNALAQERQGEAQARQVLETARREEAARARAVQDASRQRNAVVARRDAIREWQQRLEGFGAGVRALAGHPAAHGVVGQLLHITPAWQQGLAALLGPMLEALVTDDPAVLLGARTGKDAAGQVRLIVRDRDTLTTEAQRHREGTEIERGGRVRNWGESVRPISREGRGEGMANVERGGDSGSARPMGIGGADALSMDGGWNGAVKTGADDALAMLIARGVLDRDEVMGWASEVTQAPDAPLLLTALRLDRVLLVRDAQVVLRVRPHLSRIGLAAVAAGGEVALQEDGSLVFGVEERVKGALQRRDELAALEAEVEEREAACDSLHQALTQASQEVAQAEATYGAARRRAGQAEAATVRARDEARFQERLLARARQDVSTAKPAVGRLRADLEMRRARLDEDGRRLATLRDEHTRHISAQERARLALAEEEDRLGAASEGMREVEAALALQRDRLRVQAGLVRERRQRLDAQMADLARRAAQVAQAETVRQGLAGTVAAATECARAAGVVVAALEDERPTLEHEERSLQERQAAGRTAGREATEQFAAAESAHERARREAESSARDLEVLKAQVAAELRCALEELPVDPPAAGSAVRVRTLRAEIGQIGLVNHRAEEDHAAAAERLTFLQTQAEDLRAGVARLRGIITEANTTVRERFVATVEDLDRHFSVFFVRLFGGGACRLIPTYDERGLPSGMEMQAQPPGKRTRDLALLSGGERALVALALLFAMLEVRPVPFCLLDEVEAALDESNTGRFGAILRELCVGTQFLLITHNRGTMLHADCLYGVTMGETGISSTVSLELDRADDPGERGSEGAEREAEG